MRTERFTDLLSAIVDNRGRTCPVGNAGTPLIATNCIRNDALYPVFDKVRFVSQETYNTWFRGHPRPGDIILVCKGSPGRVCLAPDPVGFCIAQDMVAVRPDPQKVYPLFLFALLRSPSVQAQIANMHVGTLIPHFKKGDFDNLVLHLPDDATQRFVGDLYFELSAKIDLNRRTNETLEGAARTVFKSWFVDFDPVRAKAVGRQPPGMDAETAKLFPDEFEESELGEIPKGWRVGTVGDLVEIHDSKRVPLSSREREQRQGKYPYYGATSIMDYVDDFLFDGVYVLVGEDGSVVTEAGLPISQYVWGKFWVNNHAHVLTGAAGISQEHLFLLLSQTHVAAFVTGAVQAKLSQGNLRRIPAVVPPAVVSERFGLAVSDFFACLRCGADQSVVLSSVRDQLLPRLLSGDLPVERNARGAVAT